MRSIFIPAPSAGRKSLLEIMEIVVYGIGCLWLVLCLGLEVAAVIYDGPELLSNLPSAIGQWAFIVAAFLFYPVVGLIGFLLFRGILCALARR